MARYAVPETLVETDWVKANLGKPGIKLVEIDVDTKAYDAGHIPGAVGFNWQTQLQDQVKRDNNNWFAAYGFWLFKIYGHREVRLMNGGRVKWLNEPDKTLTTEVLRVTPVPYKVAQVNLELRAFVPQVFEASRGGKWNLVDVRSPDEFTGKVIAPPGMSETAQRGGHIPGAKSIPWSTAVNQDGTFKSADDLLRIYCQDKGVDPGKDTIAYCRIGERSSHTWFVLKYLIGINNVKNYDGSWTEYGNLVAAPIEKS